MHGVDPIHMIEAAPADDLKPSARFKSYCLLTPFCTAPGSLAAPVLCVPAAVSAPEVLASPRGEGALLAPVVPWFMVPSFIAPSDAPGPTLPWLDAPPVGWVVCAKAVGVASAKMQAEASSIFFIWSPWGSVLVTRGKWLLIAFVPIPAVAIGRRLPTSTACLLRTAFPIHHHRKQHDDRRKATPSRQSITLQRPRGEGAKDHLWD